jgi:hypothetical protein
VPGEVPQQDRRAPPGEPARDVVDEEPAVRHLGGTRERGHDGPEERHEPAQEHGGAAAPGEEHARLVEPFRAPPQHPEPEQPRAEPVTDLVPHAVPDHRRTHDDRHHHRQRGVAGARRDTAEHGRRLAREHEPHEQRVLREHERRHEEVHRDTGHSRQRAEEARHAPIIRPRRGRGGTPPTAVADSGSGPARPRGW